MTDRGDEPSARGEEGEMPAKTSASGREEHPEPDWRCSAGIAIGPAPPHCLLIRRRTSSASRAKGRYEDTEREREKERRTFDFAGGRDRGFCIREPLFDEVIDPSAGEVMAQSGDALVEQIAVAGVCCVDEKRASKVELMPVMRVPDGQRPCSEPEVIVPAAASTGEDVS